MCEAGDVVKYGVIHFTAPYKQPAKEEGDEFFGKMGFPAFSGIIRLVRLMDIVGDVEFVSAELSQVRTCSGPASFKLSTILKIKATDARITWIEGTWW
jgi:hypothetical protein